MAKDDISRRDFMIGGAKAAIGLAIGASVMSIPGFIFGDGDGGGGGGEGGEGHGGGAAYGGWDMHYLWFDRGGFAADNTVVPAQGWGDDSIAYFIDLMNDYMKSLGHTKAYHDAPRGQINNRTSREMMYDVCHDALNRAINRANSNPNALHEVTRARIVAIGWVAEYLDAEKTDWEIRLRGEDRQPFTKLIPRRGRSDELVTTNASGKNIWSDTVDAVGHVGETWREYIYNIGKEDLTDTYHFVALAVVDSEPSISRGGLSVKKVFSGDKDREFHFKVTYSGEGAPDPDTFSLKSGATWTRSEEIPAGVRFKIVETEGSAYGAKFSPSDSGIIESGKTILVTCDNSSGFLCVHKDSTE